MLRVVSVSLGSSARDKVGRATFLDETVELSRVGTDGDTAKAARIIAELDGKVDAIGLGGLDLYLYAAGNRYTIRDAWKLAQVAKTTPVVDGGILKRLLEPRIVAELAAEHPELPPLRGAKALVVCGVDRWGMSAAIAEYAGEVIFGDLMYSLGLPIALHSLAQLRRAALVVGPVITKLPISMIYPTSSKSRAPAKPRFSEYFTWADWICGDYHYIARNMPPRLDGKVVLTNTTTEADQQALRERGCPWLVTTTPVVEGRSFGMNVLEGCITALIARSGDPLTDQNYEVYLNKLKLGPNIMQLQS